MTLHASNTLNDKVGNDDWLATFANRVYGYFNRSNDRLHNLNDLYQSIIYASLMLSLVVPCICFVVFVYPTTVDYATSKAQLASIPLLKRQVTQLEQMYRSAHATLTELEADPLLAPLHNPTLQHNAIDLHRMAHDHRLRIVATNTINDHQISPQFTEDFTVIHLSWHLRGRFGDYLAFKKALWEVSPLTQIEREHLSTKEDRQLDIVVDLSVYQSKEAAL